LFDEFVKLVHLQEETNSGINISMVVLCTALEAQSKKKGGVWEKTVSWPLLPMRDPSLSDVGPDPEGERQ
jgi:hypothetical protein